MRLCVVIRQMSTLDHQLHRLATVTADYREADGFKQTTEKVEVFLSQFPASERTDLARTLSNAFEKSYVSKTNLVKYIDKIAQSKKFCGLDPAEFWATAELLNIQTKGNSQADMVAALNARIKALVGKRPPKTASTFIYIDDAIFSGGTAKSDLEEWVRYTAPVEAELRIVTIGLHGYGQYSVQRHLGKIIREVGKDIKIAFWAFAKFANNPNSPHKSDVLWPREIPDNQDAREYVNSLKYSPKWRIHDDQSVFGLFESEADRHFLEQTLLIAGLKVRSVCPSLNDFQRPLGNHTFSSLGFGSLFVTFRNCANNVPIALWASDPWIPLLPRKTNTDTAFEKLIESLS